jgi:ribosomal protein S18 acetylase RimI-like enzyme
MQPADPVPALLVRPGRPADAAALAAFGERCFRDAFAAENRPADLELYLAHAYGERQQAAELADPLVTTLLVEVDGRLAGFAQLRPGEPPPCVGGPAPLELWRFYVDRRWHGKGLAQALMSAAMQAASERGAHTLWLGVWERNSRAQGFYRKSGFRDVGAQVFVLGTDQQNDRVMAMALGDAG